MCHQKEECFIANEGLTVFSLAKLVCWGNCPSEIGVVLVVWLWVCGGLGGGVTALEVAQLICRYCIPACGEGWGAGSIEYCRLEENKIIIKKLFCFKRWWKCWQM